MAKLLELLRRQIVIHRRVLRSPTCRHGIAAGQVRHGTAGQHGQRGQGDFAVGALQGEGAAICQHTQARYVLQGGTVTKINA